MQQRGARSEEKEGNNECKQERGREKKSDLDREDETGRGLANLYIKVLNTILSSEYNKENYSIFFPHSKFTGHCALLHKNP